MDHRSSAHHGRTPLRSMQRRLRAAVMPTQVLICLLVAGMLFAVGGCGRSRPADAKLDRAGELKVCGQRYRIDTRSTSIFGSVVRTMLTMDVSSLLGMPWQQPDTKLVVWLYCDRYAQHPAAWAPEHEQWVAVIDRTELGLREYRRNPTYPDGPNLVLFTPLDEGYRQPDGSPFVIDCTANQQWQPLECDIHHLHRGVHVKYTLDHPLRLAYWREFDTAIRRYLGH